MSRVDQSPSREPDPGSVAGRLSDTEPRPLPGARSLRTALRTLHLLAFGCLYGGAIYGIPEDRLGTALDWTAGSGLAFALLETYRAPIFLTQLRGIATFVKVALLAAIYVVWELRVPLLTIAAIIGAISSHMPGRLRYYSVVLGAVAGPQEKG